MASVSGITARSASQPTARAGTRPGSRLTIVTVWPAARSASHAGFPTSPVPPVTSTRMVRAPSMEAPRTQAVAHVLALARSPCATRAGMTMPLEGIRVIDWTIWQQGPVASVMLGDLGAEVIKVEERVGGDPGRGVLRAQGLDLTDRPNFYFEANNRNKKSLTVDLKKPEGVEIVHRLADGADVFVQNFRHGVAARLGLDAADAARAQPAADLRQRHRLRTRGTGERRARRSTTSAWRAPGSCSRPASRTIRRSRSPAASPTRWARSCSRTACSPRCWRASARGAARRSTRRTSAP